MLSDPFTIPFVNGPLFLSLTLLVFIRVCAVSICLWLVNQFDSPSTTVDEITDQLKRVTSELQTISQQDQFSAYTKKERYRNSLVERLKTERTNVDKKQQNRLTSIRVLLHIGTVFTVLFFAVKNRRHDSTPLFNFPFCQFPLIIWVLALNTFVTTVSNMFLRYRTNRKSTDK